MSIRVCPIYLEIFAISTSSPHIHTAADFDADLTDKQRAGRDVLEDLAQTKNPVDFTAWKAQLERTTLFQTYESEESRNRAIRRVRTELADKGVLSYDKEKQLLTYIADKGADSEDG